MTTWRDHAACRGIPLSQFFSRGSALAKGRRACDGCPVIGECLAEAMSDVDIAEADKSGSGGYRAGLTSEARHDLRKLSRSEASTTYPDQ